MKDTIHRYISPRDTNKDLLYTTKNLKQSTSLLLTIVHLLRHHDVELVLCIKFLNGQQLKLQHLIQ